jgi:hypothetical protein
MSSLPLLPFFLFVIPVVGIGLAMLVAVLHLVPRHRAAQAARFRNPLAAAEVSNRRETYATSAHDR